MKLLKPPPLYFTLTLTGCLLLSMTPAAQGFMAFEHERGQPVDAMIDKVHEPHWDIAYRYGDDCHLEERGNDAALTAAVTEALQIWLQPLRDYTQRPIVNDFRYRLNVGRKDADFTIVFFCKIAGSLAWVGGGSPRIDLREGTEITPDFMSILVHEMGHIFGLADTYLRNNPELSKGGSDSTKGTQPDSAMSVLTTFHKGGGLLGRDDKIGIVWLYKVAYEGLGLRDCFFPDYELEVGPLGCRPKYPLIFALKYNHEVLAIVVLRDDPGLDVNVRDADGMTALHHAVLNNYTRVATALVQRDDINPSLKNNDGKTPLQLATQLGLDGIAALIAAHPKALANVNVRDADGMTVLHHAVLSKYKLFIQELMQRDDINPSLKNNDGQTPLQLATALGLNEIAALIAAHPKALAVDAKRTLTTTWGALKTDK